MLIYRAGTEYHRQKSQALASGKRQRLQVFRYNVEGKQGMVDLLNGVLEGELLYGELFSEGKVSLRVLTGGAGGEVSLSPDSLAHDALCSESRWDEAGKNTITCEAKILELEARLEALERDLPEAISTLEVNPDPYAPPLAPGMRPITYGHTHYLGVNS